MPTGMETLSIAEGRCECVVLGRVDPRDEDRAGDAWPGTQADSQTRRPTLFKRQCEQHWQRPMPNMVSQHCQPILPINNITQQ